MLNDVFRNQIEQVYGQKIRYPKDCEGLAEAIASKTNQRISPSTLKRLFGFVKTSSRPSPFTLDTLAGYLGYSDWQACPPEYQNGLNSAENGVDIHIAKGGKPFPFKFMYWALTTLFLGGFAWFFIDFPWRQAQKAESCRQLKNMPAPRNGGRAIAVDSLVFYLGGGQTTLMYNNNWAYDFSRNAWKEFAPMPTKRSEMGAAILGNNIYCFGGWLGNDKGMTNVAEVFDIRSNKWDSLPPLPAKLTGVNAIPFGRDIYILGGGTGETYTVFLKFDAQTKEYEVLPTPSPSMVHGSLVRVDNMIYTFGGMSFNQSKYAWHSQVFAYDLYKGKWKPKAALPVPLSHSYALHLNGKIHVFGGKNAQPHEGGQPQNTHFVYDLKRDSWERGEDLPFEVYDVQAVCLQNKILFLGGVHTIPNPNASALLLELK
jgi:N-acetylneuraminic acid mutarotase